MEGWRDHFLLGAENCCVPSRRRPSVARRRVNRLKRKVGELTMDLDILREATQGAHDAEDVRLMMAAVPGRIDARGSV